MRDWAKDLEQVFAASRPGFLNAEAVEDANRHRQNLRSTLGYLTGNWDDVRHPNRLEDTAFLRDYKGNRIPRGVSRDMLEDIVEKEYTDSRVPNVRVKVGTARYQKNKDRLALLEKLKKYYDDWEKTGWFGSSIGRAKFEPWQALSALEQHTLRGQSDLLLDLEDPEQWYRSRQYRVEQPDYADVDWLEYTNPDIEDLSKRKPPTIKKEDVKPPTSPSTNTVPQPPVVSASDPVPTELPPPVVQEQEPAPAIESPFNSGEYFVKEGGRYRNIPASAIQQMPNGYLQLKDDYRPDIKIRDVYVKDYENFTKVSDRLLKAIRRRF